MNRAVSADVSRCPFRSRRSRSGLTLTEVVLLAAVALVVSAVLFPVFNRHHTHGSRQASGVSRQKIIGIALLSYAQDYDDRLPPAAGSDIVDGKTVRTNWAIDIPLPGGGVAPGVIQAYIKNNTIFRDPEAPRGARLTYMYNDLLTTARLTDVADASKTVMTTYNEDALGNVGHAYERIGPPPNAVVNAGGRCDAGWGTFVTEAATTHFSGGSNFSFVDGHVKWYKPGAVYFPPRNSASRHYRDPKTGALLGPDPQGDMKWGGVTWAATFHLR